MWLEISRAGILYRAFMWGAKLVEDTCASGYTDRFRDRTNLCHLVRVIFVYIPLLLISQIIFIVVPLLTLTWVPIRVLGFSGWVHMLELMAILASAVGVAVLLDRRRVRYVVQANPGLITAATLAAHWIAAKKARICPLIEWS